MELVQFYEATLEKIVMSSFSSALIR